MPLLDLDTTINKYLEIINKNILEPYLISNDWGPIEEGTYKDTVDNTFDSANNKINSETALTDVLKTGQSTQAKEAGDYFKIEQGGTGSSKAATITKSLSNDLDSSEAKSIHSANLANNFYTDSDGLIYYNNTTTNIKVYDLTTGSRFQTDVSSSSPTNPGSLTDHDYYDYFVRFKVLKYIKNNYLDINVSNLQATITSNLTRGNNSITDLDNTVGTSGNLIIKMLDFLEFINIKNNDKFEATVNCLYYYYYIALLEYNTIFCSKNLEYFSTNTTIINIELIKLKPTQLSSDTVSSYEYKTSNAKDLILSSLIAIFESLIGADNKSGGTDNESLITKIFVQEEGKNTELYKLITKLLKLHYDVGAISDDPKKIKLYQIASTSATSGKDMSNNDVAFTVDSSSVSVGGAASTSIKYQLRLRMTENIAGTTTTYTLTPTQLAAIESLPVGGTIDTFITEYGTTLAGGKSIFNYSSAIADIKDLNNFLFDLSPDKSNFNELYKEALKDDISKAKIPNISYDNEDNIKYNGANTKLAAVKQELENILEHYEKAKKLNEIQGNINAAYDSIESTTANDTIQDENNEIGITLVNITKADNAYKENVDKYKTKNNELNNILKNNLYNNIFLYITIVVLILICLGLIYINNHKASLKTQYSVMLIAFLLLYYIIYTNIVVNVTETFESGTIVLKQHKDQTAFERLSTKVHIYLYSLTTKSKAYKESLKKEKNKYTGFAKSSNSKLNSLELVLNDEFINAIKSKELVKFLILFTAICIISYIVYTNTEDPTTTSIIFIILFVIILAIYFYNINLMTRTKADAKYWNHRMVMK